MILSTVLQTPVIYGLAVVSLPEKFLLPEIGIVTNWGCAVAVLLGLWAGLIIGLVTEYYTSHSYRPVREIAESQVQSAATGIIYGLALGYLSCVIPVLCLAVVVVAAYHLAGMYGISLAAL